MNIKTLISAFFVSFLILSNTYAQLTKTMPLKNYEFYTGKESLPNKLINPLGPGFTTDSPGTIIGTTFLDLQTIGSTGNRIAVCEDGSKYFCWMKLLGWPYPPAPLHIYHNWIDQNGNLNPNQFTGKVSQYQPSAHTTLDIIYGNRAAIAYHSTPAVNPTYVTLSVDSAAPGHCSFDHYNPPDEIWPQIPEYPGRIFWPYIAVDRNDRIHLLGTEQTPPETWGMRLGYTRSDDGGATWSYLYYVDTVAVISGIIDASPVSDKVIQVYLKTLDTTTQWKNDIIYIVSLDGITWEYSYALTNITNYATDNDSLWAYTDLDVIYDYNDYFHIVWNAQWVTDVDVYWRTFLFHYSEETEEISLICAHPDSLFYDICGPWNRPICKMNLGVQELNSKIFVIWTQYDTSDVSAGGYGNGDIFMSYSSYAGNDWSSPQNITNSHTPGCFPGACDSDISPSLAEVVDDSLYITYINDKAAGPIIPEHTGTESMVMYLAYPASESTFAEETVNCPLNFTLRQNYPNPFNPTTTISFTIEHPQFVTLKVYDLLGREVRTLADEDRQAGLHNIIFDASDLSSGIYFYRLQAGDMAESKRMVLLK